MSDEKSFMIYSVTRSWNNNEPTDTRLYASYDLGSVIGELVSTIKRPFKVYRIVTKVNTNSLKPSTNFKWYVEFETAEDKLVEMLKFEFHD